MPRTILNKANQRARLAKSIKQRLNNIDVLLLIASTDIINRSCSAFFQRQQYCAAVVLDVDPVSYIAAVTIDRDGFVPERIRERKRQKLLRKLPWPIVIATACDHCI